MEALRRFALGPVRGFAPGTAGVAFITWVIAAVGDGADQLSLAVCYPLLVLVVSGIWGSRAGVWAAVASAVAVNFFFIAPVHTLTVDDPRDWVSLGVMTATAPGHQG